MQWWLTEKVLSTLSKVLIKLLPPKFFKLLRLLAGFLTVFLFHTCLNQVVFEYRTSSHTTVWKLHNFSITQILREIKIGKSRVLKSAILTHWKALNFDFTKSAKFRARKMAKKFSTSRFSKIDFTQNLCDIKISYFLVYNLSTLHQF